MGQKHLDKGRIEMQASPDGLEFATIFIEGEPSYEEQPFYRIAIDDIDFEGIEVSERRDLECENRDRAKNHLSLLHDSAAPTRKRRESLITIPIKDSSAYVTVKPRARSDTDDLLETIARVDPNTQTEPPDWHTE
ncbi:hypothetical protein LC1Hm_1724 [Halomicrobium sp. LC1Hm]|nr:hypothetical protein LC1Hm_1724 [Halomicrobium sp. LC1Hm]